MAHSMQRVALGFMAAFGVLALVLGVLSIASPDLAQRDDNLRARAAKMEAVLAIRSRPGEGTTLLLTASKP